MRRLGSASTLLGLAGLLTGAVLAVAAVFLAEEIDHILHPPHLGLQSLPMTTYACRPAPSARRPRGYRCARRRMRPGSGKALPTHGVGGGLLVVGHHRKPKSHNKGPGK